MRRAFSIAAQRQHHPDRCAANHTVPAGTRLPNQKGPPRLQSEMAPADPAVPAKTQAGAICPRGDKWDQSLLCAFQGFAPIGTAVHFTTAPQTARRSRRGKRQDASGPLLFSRPVPAGTNRVRRPHTAAKPPGSIPLPTALLTKLFAHVLNPVPAGTTAQNRLKQAD